MSPLPQFNLIGGRVNLSALSHPNHCAVPPPGSGFYVAIDAGHGAILNTSGTYQYQRPSIQPYGIIEDQITFDMAQKVQSLLISDGIRVLMIRSGDAAPYAPKGCAVPCTPDTRASLSPSIQMLAQQMLTVRRRTTRVPRATQQSLWLSRQNCSINR